jgi:putative transcriptional regulator
VLNKLRELRRAQSWSQHDLAVQLRVSRQTIHALEAGKYDPSLPLAFAIARLFELAIEDIFFPEPAAPAPVARPAHRDFID